MYDLHRMARKFSITRAGITGVFGLLFKGNTYHLEGDVSFEDDPDSAFAFKDHYTQHILPYVRHFDDTRVSALRQLRWRSFIAVPLCIVAVIVAVYAHRMYDLGNKGHETLIFLTMISIIALLYWVYAPANKYKSSVKSVIFPNIFRFFGEDFHYREESPLSIESLTPSDILPHYDREHTEDYVKGVYKGVDIELVEAHMTKAVRSGKHRRQVTVFKGICVLLGMHKNFSGQTIIRQDAGRLGNWLAAKRNTLENVKLEDPLFEKRFEVYSTDQVEARYLLTPSFMERLLALGTLFGSKQLQCSFYDSKLLMMISSTQNRFETSSIFQPSTFVHDIKTILSEMSEILQIIDTLKLNQKTGL